MNQIRHQEKESMQKNLSGAQDKKFIMMTTEPVEKLVCRLAVPSIITMMISAIE